MVTNNVLHRMLKIRIGNDQGSAFTLDREGRQYLVTARHMLEGAEDAQHVSVVYENQWRSLDVNVVGVGEGEVDVAVLACPLQLSPTLPMEPDENDFFLGQQAYFLGYPFGWDTGGEEINRGVPLPFVKTGIFSAFTIGGQQHKIFIDAHVNHGFSGGPVVFHRPGAPQDFRVAGVVSGYPRRFQPVVDADGNVIARARENPGLVLAFGIRHVLALIRGNPIGFALPAG